MPTFSNSESGSSVRTKINNAITKVDGVATGATANTGALADLDTVDTAQVDNGAITLAKLADIATGSFLGRDTAGTGTPEVMTAAEARTLLGVLTATVLASTSSGEGSSLIGYHDPEGLTDEINVRDVIAEILGILDNYGTIVGSDTGDFVSITAQEVIVFNASGTHTTARPTQSSSKTVIWWNHGSQIPDNMEAPDIALGGGVGVTSANTQTGTSYTLALSDAGVPVDMTNASANTVTVPTNATVAFAVGTVIGVNQLGAGTTTVDGATGVTVNGTSGGSVDINNQYSGCAIRKTATDTWVAQGDIT